jgi:hypothetical protein
MAEPTLIVQALEAVRGLTVSDSHAEELQLLIKDLEEAKTALFVRTAEAKPMLERCAGAAAALKAAAGGSGWNDAAETAFGDFERAVSKLRNTILVRTQRAT